ncbi:MAG: hypothetical protein A3I77_02435 [Gammaproteobacteria bacterium RIFCSPLOWO2_02_FULL_42_14]|nr:MAG: hypothetical protein A3B71_02275 [Gammaproteobacteria bacterium RIFCSPHIGHO2_02_FULL_42_43]OGT53511.1 MAG: hypothetical protein A3E54_02300 [Gammaproteobacteria bacterium RIFCSPHIGHO2_12_FULL_41_25]OGT61457.1 MAG: hypothetical protein A3I77_02435 [Gammaproteobacteria bacterium RIFCSPLOWO2_02_FULL_42_14]OGT86479.1 MAG: hypothetical protein A3G86_02480 [Gammaproteobacteria bacterium RIFCSPLOWO2_12_FULL_42_18]
MKILLKAGKAERAMKKNNVGFTLIELVIFIVIIGFVVTSVFIAFNTTLQKTSSVNPQTTAIALASARMDIIIGSRRMNGFTGLTDPCVSGSPAVCTALSAITGYTITSTLTPYAIGSDSNYRIINVIVTGPQNSRADLKTVVALY